MSIDGEKLVQQWQDESAEAERTKTREFLGRFAELCQKFHRRLVFL